MPPTYGFPEYNFPEEINPEIPDGSDDVSATHMAMWYLMVLILIIIIWLVLYFMLRLLTLRQKTRTTQQRRPYMGSRSQNSMPASEPSIYVSPANLLPPPKYESMAPPSYEEVVGIHYPAYRLPDQPVNQPITTALAQSNTTCPNTATVDSVANTATNASNTATDDSNTATDDSNNATSASNNATTNTTVTMVDERLPVTALS